MVAYESIISVRNSFSSLKVYYYRIQTLKKIIFSSSIIIIYPIKLSIDCVEGSREPPLWRHCKRELVGNGKSILGVE